MDQHIEVWGQSSHLFHYNENAFHLPFLADYTFGDALIIQNWDDYVPMQAIRWIRRHKGRRSVSLLDPENWEYDEDDGLTYYERIADVERNVKICEMYAKQIYDVKGIVMFLPEAHNEWFSFSMEETLNHARENILTYRDDWLQKITIIIARQQRKRILEFASLINYKTLFGCKSVSFKENGITFYILKYIFKIHPMNKSFRIPPNQLECEEDPEWVTNFL